MHSDDTGQPTRRVETQEQAVEVLLDWQGREGGGRTIPASSATTETEAGWAFFNVNGYLGTVTWDGEVVMEEQFIEAE
jgi:hypothetical protein